MADARDPLAWQVGIWDRISAMYWTEIDPRFEPVVDGVIARANLGPGDVVIDVGTGTGAVAAKASAMVAPGGDVLAVDVSPQMLDLARKRAEQMGGDAYRVGEGRGEQIPAPDSSADAVLASLSLMYAIDRDAAAREIARVLRPGGRFVAAVWGPPDACDIVRFQQTAGSFAPAPPVAGVGPGALADPAAFLQSLAAAGVKAGVEDETLGFAFPNFELAWEVLAGVTTANLDEQRREEAKAAVQSAMWPDPTQPREFRNATRFLVGTRGVPA